MNGDISILDDLNLQLKKNPKEFFNSFGGLHDAIVKNCIFNHNNDTLVLCIDDLYSNFVGLPEYKNVKNIDLTFSLDDKLDINIDLLNKDKLKIYDIEINDRKTKISFSPSGYIELSFKEIKFSY